MKPWKRIEPTVVTKVGWRSIVSKTFVDPNGNPKEFTTIYEEDSSSAGVIALTPDLKVIVARQFRPGPERIMEEIPGGGVEKGEDPALAARRELLEETGYVPGSFSLIGTNSRDAYSNGMWHYYLALDCTLSPDGQNLDDGEYVDVVLITIDELIRNAVEDRMTDPIAVLMAYDKLLKLKQEGVNNG